MTGIEDRSAHRLCGDPGRAGNFRAGGFVKTQKADFSISLFEFLLARAALRGASVEQRRKRAGKPPMTSLTNCPRNAIDLIGGP
jgi:hypothetical protein